MSERYLVDENKNLVAYSHSGMKMRNYAFKPTSHYQLSANLVVNDVSDINVIIRITSDTYDSLLYVTNNLDADIGVIQFRAASNSVYYAIQSYNIVTSGSQEQRMSVREWGIFFFGLIG